MEKQQIIVGNIALTLYVLDNGDWALNDGMAAIALGVSEVTVRRHFQRNRNDFTEGHDWKQLSGSRHWTKQGLIRLGNYVKQKKAGALLDALGVKSRHVTRIESDVVGIISAALDGIAQIQLQHQVRGYKVDVYIPSIKLAIEIDEHSHASYEPTGEIVREFIISKELGCEVIRWNAHAPNANIGKLINQLLHRLIAIRPNESEV